VESAGRIEPALVLRSVWVTSENLDDSAEEYVTFEFSRPLAGIAAAHGFALSGYSNQARVSSHDAEIVHGHADQVLVGFAPGTDVGGFTAATVAPGAVTGAAGRAEVPATVALGGAHHSGRLDSPTLTSVASNATLNEVTYHFSHNLRKGRGATEAGKLGFYTAAGRAVPGASIVTIDDHDVTVAFARQVGDAVRFFAELGAVTGARGQGNPPTAVGAATAAPQLIGVSGLVGRTQFRFYFDEPVANVTARDFLVYTPDGQRVAGASYVRPSATVVQVAFPRIQRYGHAITMAALEAGAVEAADSSHAPNPIATQALGTMPTGSTAGPDVTSVSVDGRTGQVRYTFDTAIDTSKTYRPGDFQLVTDAGDVVAATAVVGIDGHSVLLDFDPTAARVAHAAAVSPAAVRNFRGEPNPLAAVAVGSPAA
jgi:hypothetical protein